MAFAPPRSTSPGGRGRRSSRPEPPDTYADIAIAAVVCGVVLLTDLRGAISFSGFTILLYYANANASALTLAPAERSRPRWIFAAELAGCLILAATLPPVAVAVGTGVLALGALGRLIARYPRIA